MAVAMHMPLAIAILLDANRGRLVQQMQELVIALCVGFNEQLPIGTQFGPMQMKNLELGVLKRAAQFRDDLGSEKIHKRLDLIVEAYKYQPKYFFSTHRLERHLLWLEPRGVALGLRDADALAVAVVRPQMVEAVDRVVGQFAGRFAKSTAHRDERKR